MIDLENENVLTLSAAAAHLPPIRGSKRPHTCTIYRWISRGVRGVRLESAKIGGTVVTSVEALQRFSDRCSGESTTASVPSKRRTKDIEDAESQCPALGV